MEAQKKQHEAKVITIKEDEKLKMDKMALELELKWTETLRCVCACACACVRACVRTCISCFWVCLGPGVHLVEMCQRWRWRG